jgi:Holliday junction resolvase
VEAARIEEVMTTNYQRGYNRERLAMAHLTMQGFICIGSRGSHGPVDVVAIGPQNIKLVQVKSAGVGPKEKREAIADLARFPAPACAIRELWVKEVRGWTIEVVDAASSPLSTA